MSEYETISKFCQDPENADVLKAAKIFMTNFKEMTGKSLEIPSIPAELININDKLGQNLEQSEGEDLVIFDVLHENTRTLLYINSTPESSAIILYSALKNKFQSNATYEEYTTENEPAYRKALKEAFSVK